MTLTEKSAEYASSLLLNTRNEIARIDAKAQMLLACFSVVGSIIVTQLVINKHVFFKSWTDFNSLLSVVGLSAFALALLCLIATIFPIIHLFEKNRKGIFYYNDVVRNRANLAQRINDTVTLNSELKLDQLIRFSKLVKLKYSLLQSSLICVVISFFVMVIAFAQTL